VNTYQRRPSDSQDIFKVDVVLGEPASAHIDHASWHILMVAATSLKAVTTLPMSCQLVSEDDKLAPPAVNLMSPTLTRVLIDVW